MKIVVTLKDGRTIDISDLSPEVAIAKLRAEGVKTEDIQQTTHFTPRAVEAR